MYPAYGPYPAGGTGSEYSADASLSGVRNLEPMMGDCGGGAFFAQPENPVTVYEHTIARSSMRIRICINATLRPPVAI